jgi:hypothetical protein
MKTNLLFYVIIYLMSSSQMIYSASSQVSDKKKVPVLTDISKFTNDWRNDKSIRAYFLYLKKNNEHDVIECYFTLSSSNRISLYNCDRDNLKDFYEKFTHYKWNRNDKFNYYNQDSNVKLTIELLANKGVVNVRIEVLSKYSPKDFVLNYETIYLHQEKFK